MCEEIWGSGKFFMTTPFRSLENAPFLENVPSRGAKDSQPMDHAGKHVCYAKYLWRGETSRTIGEQ